MSDQQVSSTRSSTGCIGSRSTRTNASTVTSQYSNFSPLEPISWAGNVKSSSYGAVTDGQAKSGSERCSDGTSRQSSLSSLGLFGSRFHSRTKFRLRSLRHSYVHRRFPCNQKIWLVYAMFFLQGLAEFSALIYLFFGLVAYKSLNPPHTVAVYLLTRCLVFTAFPVMGLLADTFFGRYRTIKGSLYMCLLGAATLAVGLSTARLDPWLEHDKAELYWKFDFSGQHRWSQASIVFIGVLYAVMLIGITGVQVNLIPFGVDQLLEASSGELSSYFHWYFWWLSAGYLTSAVTVPYIYQNYSLGALFLLIAVCFTGEILILILHRDGFVLQPPIGSQLKLIYQVLKCSLRAKKPVFKSAFDVGRPPPSRIDRAMSINGGNFTVEQVEDVKTVMRILVILLSFFGYFAVSAQLLTTYLLEGIRMTAPNGAYEDCTTRLLSSTHFFDNATHHIECQKWTVPPSLWMALTTYVPLLILIPLLDRLCYVSCRPKMLKRIAIGKIFLLTSILVAIAVEIVRFNRMWEQFEKSESTIVVNAIPLHTESSTTFHVASPLSILCLTPQYCLFAFAEVFASITAVEFIYAQSPGAMKGLLLGMLFLTSGLAMGFSALAIYLQGFAEQFHFLAYFGNSKSYVKDILKCISDHHNKSPCVDGPLFAYIILAIAVVLSCTVFVMAAFKYTLRKRDIEPFDPRI